MSAPPQPRRSDKLMSQERLLEMINSGFCGRLATIGPDGYPYCVPLLYVWLEGAVYVHNTAAPGHLRANVEHNDRVCFEIDTAGAVFNYGRFECDSSVEYSSVILFGRVRVVQDEGSKALFCDALMAKYGRPDSGRPQGFYPRLKDITVYAIQAERMAGKETPLPDVSEQWPAKDRTMTPHARPHDRESTR